MVLRVLVVVALLGGVARADDRPWAKGVPADRQADALKKYEAANGKFERGNYLEALADYVAALESWDPSCAGTNGAACNAHPGIHYNTAVCLINLDRSVEAYDHLQKAMAYGEAPLGKDLWTQAKTYERMLNKQVGTLVVKLAEPGAVVMLDGKELALDPETRSVQRRLLATEEHLIVAKKDRYETTTQPIRLDAGKTTTIVLELKLKTTGKLERRWKKWVPWAVITTGGVIAVAGAPFLLAAKSGFDTYDEKFATACPDGCASSDPALAVDGGARARSDDRAQRVHRRRRHDRGRHRARRAQPAPAGEACGHADARRGPRRRGHFSFVVIFDSRPLVAFLALASAAFFAASAFVASA
jgi:hypothetical protein